MLVVAGPGAGKTELLAQRASYLLQTGECPSPYRILAISFKRDAAENLKARVILRCGRESAARLDSMTYDAFAKDILDRFRLSLPATCRPSSNYRIITDRDAADERFREMLVGLSPDLCSLSDGARQTIDGMTMHKSKGLEFHTVIFLGLEDSAIWNYERNAEEETCGLFVALSRAKERCIFTFCRSRPGRYGTPQTQSRLTIKRIFDLFAAAGVRVEKIN